jgi:FAD/FMN-containing dehydrogenase
MLEGSGGIVERFLAHLGRHSWRYSRLVARSCPGDAGRRERGFGDFDSIRPAGVVRAAAADDVPASIRFARDNAPACVAKSGAHSLVGAAIVENGLVVDVGSLKGISYADDVAIFGRKRLLVIGGLVVTAGEFVTASAPGVQVVRVGQILAGLGAAALFPTTPAMPAAGTHTTRTRSWSIALWAGFLSIRGGCWVPDSS